MKTTLALLTCFVCAPLEAKEPEHPLKDYVRIEKVAGQPYQEAYWQRFRKAPWADGSYKTIGPYIMKHKSNGTIIGVTLIGFAGSHLVEFTKDDAPRVSADYYWTHNYTKMLKSWEELRDYDPMDPNDPFSSAYKEEQPRENESKPNEE